MTDPVTARAPDPRFADPDRRLRETALLVFPLGGLYHLALVFVFRGLDAMSMAWLNVGSVALWALATVMVHRGHLLAAMGVTLAELLVHAVAAAFLVGVDLGFHYYIVVALLFSFFLHGRWPFKIAVATVCVATLVGILSFDMLGGLTSPFSAILARQVRVANFLGSTAVLIFVGAYYSRRADELQGEVRREFERSEGLLLNILPAPVAARLKADEGTIAERFDEVTVLFADICGFTPLSTSVEPEALVDLLNAIFSELDRLCDEHGLEKIKTIGDAYMVASGLPEPRPDHVAAAARFALEAMGTFAAVSRAAGYDLQMRIGIHTGPAVAGVIGTRRFSYDVWGDTVNTAARLESHGEPGRIQVSAAVAAALGDRFELEERGPVSLKGRGELRCFFLVRER